MAAIPLRKDPTYPESDGKPMAETGLLVHELLKLYGLVQHHFRDRTDVYASANMLLYYVEGDPRSCVAPDLYVARGVAGNHERRTYQVWREGRPPCFVLEVTSDSTWREDLHKKKAIYARIGVEEYFLFDLLGDYLEPPLQGFELSSGRYQPMAPRLDGALVSRTLGLTFRPTERGLRLFATDTGEPLLELGEMAEQYERMAARLGEATAQAEQAAAQAEEANAQAEKANAHRPSRRPHSSAR
jgi:hypothetical protein